MTKKFLIMISVLLIILLPLSSEVFGVAESNGTASIQAANSSINLAFTNILIAEKAGANVTQLLKNLNNAAELLAEADNAYQAGNLNVVGSRVDNAVLIANQVNNDAILLQHSTINQSRSDMLLTIIFSVSAAAIYVFILLVFWRRLKNGYNKKLLSMKPRVVKNGT